VQAFVQARSCRRVRVETFVETFVEILGAQSGSIADGFYRVRGGLSNRGIGELSGGVLGGDIPR